MSDDDLNPTAPVPPPAPATQAVPAAAPSAQAGPAAPHRNRPWWILGGGVAGVLLLAGGVATGVLLTRDETTVVVDRSALTSSGQVTDGSSSGTSGSTSGGTTSGSTTTGGTGTTTLPAWATTWVDADDIELWGDTLTAATAAAFEAAAGTEVVVTSAERSDDPTHTYEIELTRQDGAEMDVYLDADFGVVATNAWHS